MDCFSNYFLRIACAAALAFTASLSVSCSLEDISIELSEQPAVNTVHFTATLAAKGAATRSVDEYGHTAWQVGDELYLYIPKPENDYIDATAVVTDLNNDGSAIIEATLNGVGDGDEIRLCYPAYMYSMGSRNSYYISSEQHGNLTGDNGISKLYDVAEGSTTISVNGDVATVNGRVAMDNMLCICKFHLSIGTLGEGDTFTPSEHDFESLKISIGNKNQYLVTSDKPKDGGGTRGFMDGDDIYVAMEPIENEKIFFAVSRLNDVTFEPEAFTMTVGKGTLAKGKFYRNIPLRMTPEMPVIIPDGGTYTLTNAIIYNAGTPAIVCEGDATIILEGDNSIKTDALGKAAIQAGPAGSTLTIRGNGSLKAQSGSRAAAIGCSAGVNCGDIVIKDGQINVKGGANAAGIGCGLQSICGNISISGGTVTATGGIHGAGIGGSSKTVCSSDIIISGGSVTAKGGSSAAGIGSGHGSNSNNPAAWGNITISGGTISATGNKYAAAIGSGYLDSSCGDITITTGITRISANKDKDSGSTCDSIGAGRYASCGTVFVFGAEGVVHDDISYDPSILNMLYDGAVLTGTLSNDKPIMIAPDATVTLSNLTFENDQPWPAISCAGNATIILDGDNTVTSMAKYYPAILPGHQAGSTLTISGSGSLKATATESYAAAIGGGSNDNCGNISITGGTITASAKEAGIGGGKYGSCGNITISGGSVDASSVGGAGIGSGSSLSAKCGNILITSGITEVHARTHSPSTSTSSTLPIGPAGRYSCGTITFDTIEMYKDYFWTIFPTNDQNYGNLHFTVSSDNYPTWTLTPAPGA